MIELLLVLGLSCTDINEISQRVFMNKSLGIEEKKEIIYELENSVPNCKVEIVF